MIELMKQAIDVLKNKIATNLEVIKRNESKFQKIMADGNFNEFTNELNFILENNRNLLAENFDYINVQLSLLKFLEKYRSQINSILNYESDEKLDIFLKNDKQSLLHETLNGRLSYNASHPLIHDENFFIELMKYYETTADYTKCYKTLEARVTAFVN